MKKTSCLTIKYFLIFTALCLVDICTGDYNIDVLYDSAMTLISKNEQGEKAIPVLSQIVEIEPEYKDAYEHYVTLCVYYNKFTPLIRIISELTKQFSENGKYHLNLAEAYFRQGKIKKADAILIDHDNQISNFSKTRKALLKAKTCFDRNQDAKGQAFYEQALSNISSGTDNEAIFKDIIYIISDVEFALYDSTPLIEKTKFYHAFWKKRDPTPNTKQNERIPEHFRRLFYAKKHYRKFSKETILDNPSIYENDMRDFEDLQFMGFNPFERLKLPRGMEEQTDIDDQGCIYIRHGKPDDTEQLILESNFFKESSFNLIRAICIFWQYYASAEQPEVIHYFLLRKGNLRLLAYPLSTKNLEFLDPRFSNASISKLQNLVEENKAYIEKHVQHETTQYEYGGKPLKYPFVFLDFKNKDKKSSLECYYGVPLKEFKPNKDEPAKPIQIEKSIALFDKNWVKVDTWQHTDKFATDDRNKGWKDILYLNKRYYTLKPGMYNFALQVRDPHSKKIGIYKGSIEATDYHNDSLQISSVLLATNLSPETPQSLFAKDGVQFTPKFNREFKRDKPLGMYYEVYNLSYNSKGQTDYEMNYSVWRYKKREEIENPENRKPVISTGVKQSGRKRDEKVWMSFDMADHKKGKYVIEILVRDKLTGERVRKLIPVELK